MIRPRIWLYAGAAALALYAAAMTSGLLNRPPKDSRPAGAETSAAAAEAAAAALRGRLAAWEAGEALLDAGKNVEAAGHFERELAKAPGALELAGGLVVSRSRLCAPDTALSYLNRMLSLLKGAPREALADFLAGAGDRRGGFLLEAASSFHTSAAIAAASGDTLSAAVAERLRVSSALMIPNGPGAFDVNAEYGRLARSIPSERFAADASAVEAECLAALDRYAGAESLYVSTLPRAREAGWRGIESRCLSGLARLDDGRGRDADAAARYGAGLALERAMGDLEGIASLLVDLGRIEVRARSLEGALAHFEEAEGIALSCRFDRLLGRVYHGRGAVAEARGERSEAIELFERARSLHARHHDAQGELDARLRLGYLNGALGEHASAIEHYEFASAHYEKAGDLDGRGAALAGLAAAYRRLGDFARAEESYRRALAVKRELGDRGGAAWALGSLSALVDLRGRCREALSLAREALSIYEELGDRGGAGEAAFGMGSVYLHLGDYARAIELYDRSFAVAAELGDGALLGRAADGMRAVYAAAGRPDLAAAFYEKYLALARRSEDRIGVARALGGLASLAAERGENEKARELAGESLRALPAGGQDRLRAGALYLLAKTERGEASAAHLERALALADSSGFEELRWKCLSDLGERALEAGDTAQAFSYQHRAVVSVESLRRLAGSDGPRGPVLEPAALPYERVVSLLLLRSGLSAEVKEALIYVERCRAQKLAALVREALRRSDERGSGRVLEEEREILSRLAYYEARLRDGSLDPAERARVMEGIEAVEGRFSKLSVEFENGGRPHAAELYPRIEQTDELLGRLSAGERMLSYFLGERRSFLFSAVRDSIEVFELPPRPAIEARVEAFLGILRQLAREGAGDEPPESGGVPPLPSEVLEFASRGLFDVLLGPVAKRIAPGEALVIVPDGLLARLPFALLEKNGRYLVEDHDISYAPSLRELGRLRERNAMRARSKHRPAYDVVAVGAGGGPAGERAGTERGYPCTAIPIEPLAGAGEEARMIGSLFGRSLVLAGRGARESFFKASPLYDAGILHLCARAYVDDADPRRSFVVLDPERSFADTLASPGEDGLLQWHEAASLGLNCAIVALPVCLPARTELASGEGMTGFARAFFHAGAGSVLVAEIEVPEGLAWEMMEEYYKGIRRGMASAPALAAAQRACLARGGAFARPAFWGAFRVIGDGAAAPELSPGFDPATWISIVILVAAGAAFVWNALRRRRFGG